MGIQSYSNYGIDDQWSTTGGYKMTVEFRGKKYPESMLNKESPCCACKMSGNCHPEYCLLRARWDQHKGVRDQIYD